MVISRVKIQLTSMLILLMTVVAISPFWHAFFPVNGNIISLLTVVVIVLIKGNYHYANKKYLAWSAAVFLGAMFPFVFWLEFHFLLTPIYFITGIYVISLLTTRDVLSFINIATTFIFVLLVGAVFGTIYAYYGGSSILQFKGAGGLHYQLYLTTLTPVQLGGFIRPSSLFDEPGALSFITCFIAALRHNVGANKKITWAILGLGFITASVAHLLYVIFHAAQEVKSFKSADKLIKVLFIFLLVMFFLSFLPPVQDIISRFLLSRFATGEINNLGMDRFIPFLNAIEHLNNIETFLFGIHPDCGLGRATCGEHGFKPYGYNPLTLLTGWGVFLSLPYYLSLTYLLYMAIRKRNFIIFGVFALLLQRPYVMSYGYSMFILLTILVITDSFFNSTARRKNEWKNINEYSK